MVAGFKNWVMVSQRWYDLHKWLNWWSVWPCLLLGTYRHTPTPWKFRKYRIRDSPVWGEYLTKVLNFHGSGSRLGNSWQHRDVGFVSCHWRRWRSFFVNGRRRVSWRRRHIGPAGRLRHGWRDGGICSYRRCRCNCHKSISIVMQSVMTY